MSRFDMSTIGEGQIRLTVARGDRLVTARRLHMTAAGSEANVSGLLAQLGRATTWASVVPQGDLGERVLCEYRAVGVDLSNVVRSAEGRIALYFFEPGDAPMPGKVTYDRLHTAFRDASPDMFDWDSLLDTRLLFVTGITAALTERTAALVRYAVDGAAERGVQVALDVNHRTLLWSAEDARRTLEPMLGKLSILFCSRADGNQVFDIPGDGPQVCRRLRERTGVPIVVSTDRTSGVFLSTVDAEKSFEIHQVPVVDRPGAGDAFVGGTLHGVLDGDVVAGIEWGMRTASFALTHHGDLTHITAGELQIPLTTDIVR